MSAFMVDTVHIDALLTAAMHCAPYLGESRRPTGKEFTWWHHHTDTGEPRGYDLGPDTAGWTGTMLLAENRRSVNYRYSEDELEPEEAYLYTPMPGFSATPEHTYSILHALACYEYQACETRTWHATVAAAFCDTLRHKMIRRLPGYRENDTWEISDRAFFRQHVSGKRL